MNHDKEFRATYWINTGRLIAGFTICYNSEGQLLRIINPYDNTIVYTESKPVKRKRNLRRTDEGSS